MPVVLMQYRAFVLVVTPVDDGAVEGVEDVGHEVDPAGVAELDHLLEAEVQLVEGGQRLLAEDVESRPVDAPVVAVGQRLSAMVM